MTNFLEETIDKITSCDKTIEDVDWVGSDDGKYVISWNEFAKIANIDYYSGFGLQYIAMDLVVVFNDGSYLYREEYDGSEGWSYAKTPRRQYGAKTFEYVRSEDGYETVEIINGKMSRGDNV